MTDQKPNQKTGNPAPVDSGNGSDPDYKVGPGNPPNEYKWKKGGPSPYPKGRPRKEASALPDAKKIFEEAVKKKFKMKKGDKEVFLTRLDMGIDQLLTQFAKGDRHARRDVMEMAEKLGVDLPGQKGRIEDALSVGHEAILESYLARRPPRARSFPVKVVAPPELLEGIDMSKTTRPVNPILPKPAEAPPKK
jgi:hypothetical protein